MPLRVCRWLVVAIKPVFRACGHSGLTDRRCVVPAHEGDRAFRFRWRLSRRCGRSCRSGTDHPRHGWRRSGWQRSCDPGDDLRAGPLQGFAWLGALQSRTLLAAASATACVVANARRSAQAAHCPAPGISARSRAGLGAQGANARPAATPGEGRPCRGAMKPGRFGTSLQEFASDSEPSLSRNCISGAYLMSVSIASARMALP